MTVDRNILPGMKPTRHSFRCGQPLGPGVAHHGMRNLVHHAQAHVASPRGERLPAQVADHLSDAAYVVVTVFKCTWPLCAGPCQACGYFSGYVGPIPWKHIPNVVVLVIGRHVL